MLEQTIVSMEVLQTSPCHMAMGTTGWCRLEMGVYRRTDSPTENLCSRDVLDVESGTTGHHGVLVLLEILYIPKPARSFSCHLTVQLLFSEGSSSFSSTLCITFFQCFFGFSHIFLILLHFLCGFPIKLAASIGNM